MCLLEPDKLSEPSAKHWVHSGGSADTQRVLCLQGGGVGEGDGSILEVKVSRRGNLICTLCLCLSSTLCTDFFLFNASRAAFASQQIRGHFV